MSRLLSRRDVLKRAGSLAVAATTSRCVPAPAVLAEGNSTRKLNVAAIGRGGRGLYMQGLRPDLNHVALSEPDRARHRGSGRRWNRR